MLEVTGMDDDGELLARPVNWDNDSPPPTIYVLPDKKEGAALGIGEHILARLSRAGSSSYEARTIKRLKPRRNKFSECTAPARTAKVG